jgi:hypothetical protein
MEPVVRSSRPARMRPRRGPQRPVAEQWSVALGSETIRFPRMHHRASSPSVQARIRRGAPGETFVSRPSCSGDRERQRDACMKAGPLVARTVDHNGSTDGVEAIAEALKACAVDERRAASPSSMVGCRRQSPGSRSWSRWQTLSHRRDAVGRGPGGRDSPQLGAHCLVACDQRVSDP